MTVFFKLEFVTLVRDASFSDGRPGSFDELKERERGGEREGKREKETEKERVGERETESASERSRRTLLLMYRVSLWVCFDEGRERERKRGGER